MEDLSVTELEPITDVTKPSTALTRARTATPARIDTLKSTATTALARSGPMLVYQFNRLGRTGTAGAAMILFAVIFVFSGLLPQQRELDDLQSRLRQARTSGPANEPPPVRLNRFMGSLPKRSELPKIAGQVFTLAGAAQVSLERGKYELQPTRSGQLAQYRMTFPIKGSYPNIRQFIDSVLAAVPSAALEGLRVERKAVGDEAVSADLRFAVFVRNDR
jgi:hypothetical protein